jgi:hypothetical protein
VADRWKALALAPALVEGAKKLWDRVASRDSRRMPAAPSAEQALPAELRIPALEQRTAGLEDEAASSFEVVSSIAQQHSQLAEQHAELVQVADLLLARTRLLSWSCAILAAALLALFLFVLLAR